MGHLYFVSVTLEVKNIICFSFSWTFTNVGTALSANTVEVSYLKITLSTGVKMIPYLDRKPQKPYAIPQHTPI